MVLTGKLLSQTEIKCDGDVIHEFWGSKPHHISGISPDKIQGCDLHEGEWGTAGSVIEWSYFLDGKAQTVKQIIESIDKVHKTVVYKVIEGNLLELYKTFLVKIHVDTKGENNLVTWTFEYEKLHEGIEDPTTTMDFLVKVTKEIETHHL
ncbi:hypothetical protein RJ639_006914 [Escallonia herrerae]|uniref:Bet v I/Major latex protein domain-containing protein n=1 Tax=Escallonia herrerae TaxID=1293975 RepID=A0AA88W4E6_9ASTE|nr:hypothetical protein RJ639_025465 [Escallonia herrerae]KAK3016925.1 hypothetical protein RJ639_006914 [Escallonia herrerae]